MRVAQVTARLGETIVDLAHIAPGERYAIGTAPEVHFVVPGIGELPLVTSEARGFVVRRPIGLGALAVDGRPCDDAELVLGWTRVTFAHALVSLTIELVERAPIPVPRPAFDLRPIAYLAASLMIQLGIVVFAIGVGRPPRGKKPWPRLQAHPLLVHLAPLPPPAPVPPPPPHAPPAAHPAAPIASVRAVAPRSAEPTAGFHLPRDRDGNVNAADAVAALDGVTKPGEIGKMLDQVGPVYVPSAVDHPFGDNQKMDPTTRPGFGAIEIHTGRFRTSEVHDPLVASQGLALCESRRCEVTGGLAKEAIQETTATRGYELQQCMDPGADSTKLHRGAALLELDIAADGKVKKVHGQGAAARCAAAVIASLAFPSADEATHVTFTIGYP